MNYCRGCKTEKSLAEFSKHCRAKDGLESQCKVCRAESHRGYLQSHKEEIAERRRTPARKESQRKSDKKQRELYPERNKAVCAVHYAVETGRLIRSIFCEECGLPAETVGHHADYSKSLEIDWLCVPCHVGLHRKLRF